MPSWARAMRRLLGSNFHYPFPFQLGQYPKMYMKPYKYRNIDQRTSVMGRCGHYFGCSCPNPGERCDEGAQRCVQPEYGEDGKEKDRGVRPSKYDFCKQPDIWREASAAQQGVTR